MKEKVPYFALLTFLILFFLEFPPVFCGEISADLLSKIENLHQEEHISALIMMKDQLNTPYLNFKLNEQKISLKEKHKIVLNSLQNKAKTSQSELLGYLDLKKGGQQVQEFKSFWIANCVSVSANKDVLGEIAQRNDVATIYPNYPVSLISSVSSDSPLGQSKIDNNLDAIKIREVWKIGYTGKGRLVCNFDTGVEGTHPALSHNWRGNNGGSSSSSWFDPLGSIFPVDGSGHGTHTLGIMVGGTSSDTIGVAFEAQWIAAGVIDRGRSLPATIADILTAFQWASDPDGNPETFDDVPDVINNSWGIPKELKPSCDQTFWSAIDNVEALGVVCIFATGNEGPNPSTLRTPADRISSPTNSFSVGAVDGNIAACPIASFSSRGPSGCDSITIKPEVVAPGVGIRSCYLSGGYKLMNGTSMAAPFVSGAVAVLRQFNPDATVEEIKQALLNSALDLGPPGEDNSYGRGLIDIRKALDFMPIPGEPQIHLDSFWVETCGDSCSPETLKIWISLKNWGTGAFGISALISASDLSCNVVQNSHYFGDIDNKETVSNLFHPFIVVFDSALSQEKTLNLSVKLSGENPLYSNDILFSTKVGCPRWKGDHNIGNLVFTISNLGIYGLGNGSLNSLGGNGCKYPKNGLDNLYEGALLLGMSENSVSDAARDFTGKESDADFKALPSKDVVINTPGIKSDQDGCVFFSDSSAENPIGLIITQRSFSFDDPSNDDYIILEYTIKNTRSIQINGLYTGLFFDWDIPLSSPSNDKVGMDTSISLGFEYDPSSNIYLGIASLNFKPIGINLIDNGSLLYDGFSEKEKYQLLSGNGNYYVDTTSKDWSVLASCGPFDILPNDSIKVAFSIVGGNGLAELKNNASASEVKYNELTTSVDEDDMVSIPQDFQLKQNYPNPFNPVTTIPFHISGKEQGARGKSAEDGSASGGTSIRATLSIYNILGQRVRTLVDEEKLPGEYRVIWDGKDDSGKEVSSGVYFYQLKTGDYKETKRMLLVK
jgi:hypothetical protein